jgi:uncharacterized membrane protein YphA (DoxX/SURF4 family)
MLEDKMRILFAFLILDIVFSFLFFYFGISQFDWEATHVGTVVYYHATITAADLPPSFIFAAYPLVNIVMLVVILIVASRE